MWCGTFWLSFGWTGVVAGASVGWIRFVCMFECQRREQFKIVTESSEGWRWNHSAYRIARTFSACLGRVCICTDNGCENAYECFEVAGNHHVLHTFTMHIFGCMWWTTCELFSPCWHALAHSKCNCIDSKLCKLRFTVSFPASFLRIQREREWDSFRNISSVSEKERGDSLIEQTVVENFDSKLMLPNAAV